MARPRKQKHLLKNKQIKINVTESELNYFNIHKNRLLEYSPALSANDLLRYVINNIDDLALVQFTTLDNNSLIRVQLLSEFLLTHEKIEKV